MSLEQFDLRCYLQHLGIPFWEAGKNVSTGWVGIQCIYCDDHHNHLGISLTHKNYSCWKCGAKGNLIDLIQDLEDIRRREAAERIDEFQTDNPVEPVERERLEDRGQNILPKACYPELTPRMRRYLESRRYDPDRLAEQWDLWAGPITGRWKYRIIIPVKLDGRIVTWIGMSTVRETGAIKYLAASVEESIIPCSELIYGADYVDRSVVIVEGVTDVWRIGNGAVAVLGIGASAMTAKINRLVALGAKRYYVMFDAEEQAQEHAQRLARTLAMTGKTVEVLELDEGDPDDMSDEEARKLREDLGL